MDISDIDLGWLAGLLEGEGSFFMTRSHVGGKIYLYPKIVVGMTDQDVIQRVANLFGNGVYVMPIQPNRKQAWRTEISGKGAIELMKQLLPHMGVRRTAKINEVIAAHEQIGDANERRKNSCSIAADGRLRNELGQFVH